MRKKIDPLKKLEKDCKYPIEFVEADLLNTDSWKTAVKDVTRVIHVASPHISNNKPEDDQLIIKPAIDGTLNILKAAFEEKSVKHVVVTSSGLAIAGYLNVDINHVYTEADWPKESNLNTAYSKSKYLAEKAAWDFIEEKKKNNIPCFDLTVINPVMVLGPLLNSNVSNSVEPVLGLFLRKFPIIPDFWQVMCDVRDVALAHIRAVTLPQAAGQRYIVSTHKYTQSLLSVAQILNEEFGPKGYLISTEISTEVTIRSSFKDAKLDNSKMINQLNIQPTDFKKTIIDMAYSFIEQGLVKI